MSSSKAKKKLNKLKKITGKHLTKSMANASMASTSMQALFDLKKVEHSDLSKGHSSKGHTNKSNSSINHLLAKTELNKELSQLSKQVAQDVIYELAAPFNPLLSWFNVNKQPNLFASSSGLGGVYSRHGNKVGSSSDGLSGKATTSVSSASLASIPLKSPPCKKCPAMGGGLCKCAVKRFG